MGKYFICAGHTLTGTGTGANGYINESNENRFVAKKVVEYLKMAGHTAVYGEINNSKNYLADQVALANKDKYDLVVQIHFNANVKTSNPMGTETWYYDNVNKAKDITNKLGTIYKNRGAKASKELYWLKNTKCSALLVEVCFVDSKADVELYMANANKTAKLIAEGIIGKSIAEAPNTKPPKNIIKIQVDGIVYDMEGVLIDGNNFLKVRELEKAGYKIGFSGSMATIDKP